MSDTDKCPHCGADRSPISKHTYACGTFDNSGCTDTFPATALCAERAAHAETKRELSSLTDTLDLMRDEFQRIVARMVESGTIITDVGQEILTICNRARSQIAQRVPVIAQRDAAESRVRELEGLRIEGFNYGVGLLTVTIAIPYNCRPYIGRTLGEAMPRREGV